MKKPRLIQILEGLNPGELRRFESFVASPYFNQSETSLKLLRYLMGLHPDYPGELLAKARLFRAMYGSGPPFKAQAVHDQMSQLLRLLEQFFSQEHFRQDETEQKLHLLGELSHRRLGDHFGRQWRQVEQEQEEAPHRNSTYFLQRYRSYVYADTVAGQHQTRQIKGRLPEAVQNLDTYYLATRLRLSCEMVNRRNLVNAEYETQFIDQVLQMLSVPGNPYQQVPVIAIYYHIYLTLTEKEADQHYHTLVNLLSQHDHLFPPDEAYSMYAYAQNYCIRKINQGETSFLQEILQLYQRLLENGLLLDQGLLAHEHYKNITTVGLRTRAYTWVRDFLEKYRHKLHPDIRENAYTYNLAAYFYEQQRYRDAMRLLNHVTFTDVFYHLSAKSILLKIYFESEDYDSLKYHQQAFAAFLKRNKQLPRYHIQTHSNLLRLVKKAGRLRQRLQQPEPNRASLQQGLTDIEQDIEQAEGVANLSWLRQKLAQLQQDIQALPLGTEKPEA